MYVTAHAVVDRDGREGLNAFRHYHGDEFVWPSDASTLPDVTPGKLDPSATRTEIRPGGNAVRAYLDVVAPDGTPNVRLFDALDALATDLDERRNPTVFELGKVTIRFGVQISLERERRSWLARLRTVADPLIP